MLRIANEVIPAKPVPGSNRKPVSRTICPEFLRNYEQRITGFQFPMLERRKLYSHAPAWERSDNRTTVAVCQAFLTRYKSPIPGRARCALRLTRALDPGRRGQALHPGRPRPGRRNPGNPGRPGQGQRGGGRKVYRAIERENVS